VGRPNKCSRYKGWCKVSKAARKWARLPAPATWPKEDKGDRRHKRCLKRAVRCALSNIAGSGAGQFAAKDIAHLDWMTEYGGVVITHADACKLELKEKHTHIISLDRDTKLDGKAVHRRQWNCLASFANDAREKDSINAVFVRHFTENGNNFCKRGGLASCVRVLLQATRDVAEGEEIFVSYDRSYWKRASSIGNRV
jgi:SET domain-containing protein